jgi:hypothetical protein
MATDVQHLLRSICDATRDLHLVGASRIADVAELEASEARRKHAIEKLLAREAAWPDELRPHIEVLCVAMRRRWHEPERQHRHADDEAIDRAAENLAVAMGVDGAKALRAAGEAKREAARKDRERWIADTHVACGALWNAIATDPGTSLVRIVQDPRGRKLLAELWGRITLLAAALDDDDPSYDSLDRLRRALADVVDRRAEDPAMNADLVDAIGGLVRERVLH